MALSKKKKMLAQNTTNIKRVKKLARTLMTILEKRIKELERSPKDAAINGVSLFGEKASLIDIFLEIAEMTYRLENIATPQPSQKQAQLSANINMTAEDISLVQAFLMRHKTETCDSVRQITEIHPA